MAFWMHLIIVICSSVSHTFVESNDTPEYKQLLNQLNEHEAFENRNSFGNEEITSWWPEDSEKISDDDALEMKVLSSSRKSKSRIKRKLDIPGDDESTATDFRFRTLHGKDYDPYDRSEDEHLHRGEYVAKLASKIGSKSGKPKVSPKTEEPQGRSSEGNDDLANQNQTGSMQPFRDPAHEENLRLERQSSQTSETSHMLSRRDSGSSTVPDTPTSLNSGELESLTKVVPKVRTRRKHDAPLMLEFTHNRPDERIVWIDYPDYRKNDEYRLIDERAEQVFITSRKLDFANGDYDVKKIRKLINYVEHNRKGYEVRLFSFTEESLKDRSLGYRMDACDYLINDSAMLRKLGIKYDLTQLPDSIRVAHLTVRLSVDDTIIPRRYRALACPTIHLRTSTVSTLYVAPVTYADLNADEYVLIFAPDERFSDPSNVRLLALSRLIIENSSEMGETETKSDEKLNAIDKKWWFGHFKSRPKLP